jgi:queuine tRNA-ribosyltransferase
MAGRLVLNRRRCSALTGTTPATAGVPEPIDPACPCYTCRTHSGGYLHHLFKADELLGMTLLTLHNIRFMNDLMTSIRTAIQAGRFAALKREWLG